MTQMMIIYYLRKNPPPVFFNKGMFAIFFPEDLHMPGISTSIPQNVKKVVVKVMI